MTNPPFKALLCDIDGVLRQWPVPLTDVDRIHGVAAGTLAATAFEDGRLQAAITGGISDEEWRERTAGALAETLGAATARAMVESWNAISGIVDREVLAVLVEARRRIPVALVSNATSRLETDLESLGVLDVADVVVNSSRVGCAKPDPRIYAIAAEAAGVPVEACLFVDDTEENVRAAERLGMGGLHFRDARGLREALGL